LACAAKIQKREISVRTERVPKKKSKMRSKYFNPRGKSKYVTIKCPLCKLEFDIYRSWQHRKRYHAELGDEAFEAVIRKHLDNGTLVYKAEKIGQGPSMNSASGKLAKHKREPGDSRTHMVSGGGFGLGKRR
jgi:hypothetical protein